jgi:signal transduction histidine kinase
MIISDTGTGMPKNKVDMLNNAEPVNSKAGTNEEPGWGLGYRLILDMLRLCQGRLYIVSEIKQGTVVTVVLPPLLAND